jgi:putative methyltransferase (TIGR04325 family)
MTITRTLLKDCMPPVAIRWIQQMRGEGIRYEGNFTNWSEAIQHATGYDHEEILAKTLSATLKVVRGEAAYERDSVVFNEIEYVWPILAGLLWAAARNHGHLNVLDFGGALGSTYFQHRRFLEGLTEVHWNVVEQTHFVECGNAHIATGPLRFYKDIAACIAEQSPNVVLLSGVLQYLPEPFRIVDELGRIGAAVMLIDRTPSAKLKDNHLLIQHVPASIYQASYPMWVFSNSQLLEHLAKHWNVVSRETGADGEAHSCEGLSFKFESMLLEAC